MKTAILLPLLGLGLMMVPGALQAQDAPLPRYEAANPSQSGGDRLAEPRRLAAMIVAQDEKAPQRIVEVGSFTGEFLEAFMAQFPAAQGQWTEPVTTNRDNAKRRLARFGDHIDYVIGCPARDLKQGCVQGQADVLIVSWVSIHQDKAGIARFYQEAATHLRKGGWLIVMDHFRPEDGAWAARINAARKAASGEALVAQIEGPPVHHPDWIVPTLDEQITAMQAAGFIDPHQVWQRLDTGLILARK